MQFALIAVGFASLMTYSVYNSQSFFTKLDFSLKIFKYIAYRPPYICVLLAILRQEIDVGEILHYSNITDLYKYYRENFSSNEANLMYNVHIIKRYYPLLSKYWDKLDSNEGCNLIFEDNPIRTPSRNTIISMQFKL